jgi:hypothetical protein
MVVAAIAHGAAGWPEILLGLRAAGVSADLTGALGAGWLFGSATMTASGLIVLVAAVRLRRGDRSGLAAARIVAVAFVAFGTLALVFRGFSPHFAGFVALGCLAGCPLLGLAYRPPGPEGG